MSYVCLHFILMQMSPTDQENSQTCVLIIKFSCLWCFADIQSSKIQSFTHIWFYHDEHKFAKAGRENLFYRTVC